MAVVYRTAGAWGPGKGSNLTPVEVDSNFWDVIQRLGTLEDSDPADGVLSLSGNAIADETVGIGSRTYTWKATPTAADQIKIGANASTSLDNLIAAINRGGGEGTLYGSGTAVHSAVSAAAGAGDTMVVTARVAGEVGNSIATTETMTNGSWANSTLTGGVGFGPDSIENIIVPEGTSQMTVVMASGATFGPFTLPTAVIRWRGNWTAATVYSKNDLITRPLDGLYIVRVEHTSSATFDASLQIDGVSVYTKILTLPGFPTMNFKGAWEPFTEYILHDTFYVESVGVFTVIFEHTSFVDFDPDAVDIDDNPLYIQLVDWTTGIGTDESEGIDFKDPVDLASTINIALTAEQTIDGILTSTSRVLLKNQNVKTENGIWDTAAGAWARSADANEDAEVSTGMAVLVREGTENAARMYVLTTANPIVLGTTELQFARLRLPAAPRKLITVTDALVEPSKSFKNIILLLDSASPQTLDFALPDLIGVGHSFLASQIGAGQVTVTATGATLEVETGVSLALTRYRVYEFIKIGTHRWLMQGIPDVVAGSFLGLSDTPDDYTGQAGKVPAVNVGETGLEFITVSGGGASAFTALTDVPASYVGHANKAVVVKGDETGLQFTSTSGAFVLKAGDTMTGPLVLPAGTVGSAALVVDDGGGIYRVATGVLGFTFGGAQGFRASANGIGIGADPTSTIQLIIQAAVATQAQIIGDGATATFGIFRYQSNTGAPLLNQSKARGSVAVPTIVVSNDQFLVNRGRAYSGSAFVDSFEMTARIIEATPSTSALESDVRFSLNPSGSVSLTEIMRLSHAAGLSMFGANIVIDSNRIYRQRVYTVATLPAAGTAGRGPAWASDALAAKGGPMLDNGTAWMQLTPFDPGFFYAGVPPVSTKIWGHVATRAWSLPNEYAGSQGYFDTAPSGGSVVLDVKKNGVAIGTITFADGSNTATFSNTVAGADDLAAGDRISIHTPGNLRSASDLHVTLMGIRTS